MSLTLDDVRMMLTSIYNAPFDTAGSSVPLTTSAPSYSFPLPALLALPALTPLVQPSTIQPSIGYAYTHSVDVTSFMDTERRYEPRTRRPRKKRERQPLLTSGPRKIRLREDV